MTDYTKRGFKLHHEKDLVFQLLTRYVRWTKDAGFQRGADVIVAVMQIVAPSTHGHAFAALKGWLSAYDDPELLVQLDEVVASALAKLSEVPEDTPSLPPQKGQVN